MNDKRDLQKVTIVSCWDGGDHYSYEYVNRLYRACKRNTSYPFDFVLYVGPLAEKNPGIFKIDPEVKFMQTGLPYWWCGMPFWKANPPGIETEVRLHLDLDIVIVGSLDGLLGYPSAHCCSLDFPEGKAPHGQEKDINPGVTLIRGDAGAWVWKEYLRHGMPTWNPFDRDADKPLPLAAQAIINEVHGADAFPGRWCASYKFAVQGKGLPEDCRTVHFHGRPKQGDVEESFVKENWI